MASEIPVSKVRVARDPAPEPAKVRKAVDVAIKKADKRIAEIVRDTASPDA